MKPYKKIVSTLNLPREEWLQVRKGGIGGSDIGAIIGVNKWSSAFNVYIDKTTDHNNDLSDNEAVYWGTALEEIVAKEFEVRTGKKVRRLNAILQSTETPFAYANVDRMICGESAGLECKTTNAFNSAEWKDDEVPASYILQCQWYMYVTGCDKWYIACLIGGQRFAYKVIEREDEIIKSLIDVAYNFWENNVFKKIPPDVDGTLACTEYIKEAFPEDIGSEIPMTDDIVKFAKRLTEVKTLVKQLKDEQTVLENRIKVYLGENTSAVSERYTVNWKNQNGKPALDTDRLVKDYKIKNLSEYYNKTTIRKFTIKENKN